MTVSKIVLRTLQIAQETMFILRFGPSSPSLKCVLEMKKKNSKKRSSCLRSNKTCRQEDKMQTTSGLEKLFCVGRAHKKK